MSEFVINEGALNRFFHNRAGPVGTLLLAKANEIETHARNNLAPHYRSGDAVGALAVGSFQQDSESLFILVGTDAAHTWRGHEDFNYPIALELGGVTPQGSAYHYPFLGPAVEAAGFRKGS